ncbi:Thoeris anti-defense Tad2 family protein [Lacticaseibacillus pantheris]|uniref:Thoeris anti-defense Tad2 family protein n=1 Tax=Lacticaseibacillus pantheris TaxID=171523 RepID=UPI003F512765
MDIRHAIMAERKTRRGIARRAWKGTGKSLIPTSGGQGMVVIQVRGNTLIPRWEPSSDDLVANDWFVCGLQGLNGQFQRSFYSIRESVLDLADSLRRKK